MKSFQRFTETWATLERAAMVGLFDRLFEEKPPSEMPVPAYLPVDKSASGYAAETAPSISDVPRKLRIASLGGGPGYLVIMEHMRV